MPLVSALRWDTGVQFHAGSQRADATVAVTTGTLSDPRVTDNNAGKQVATKCQSCHNLDQGGPNMTGPNLYGVLGRQPGTHPGFAYSDVLKKSGIVWSDDTLDAWIKNPAVLVPHTLMSFAGITQAQTRANIIAYLNTLR